MVSPDFSSSSMKGHHSANVFYRYVDSYDRNEAANTDSIDSFGQVDLQYGVRLAGLLGDETETSITVGVLNALDEEPPFVAIAGSYDPRTGDPRGQRAYLKLGLSF